MYKRELLGPEYCLVEGYELISSALGAGVSYNLTREVMIHRLLGDANFFALEPCIAMKFALSIVQALLYNIKWQNLIYIASCIKYVKPKVDNFLAVCG